MNVSEYVEPWTLRIGMVGCPYRDSWIGLWPQLFAILVNLDQFREKMPGALCSWLVLCEFSTDSLQSWRLDSPNTLLFEVATPTVFFCYNRVIPGHKGIVGSILVHSGFTKISQNLINFQTSQDHIPDPKILKPKNKIRADFFSTTIDENDHVFNFQLHPFSPGGAICFIEFVLFLSFL